MGMERINKIELLQNKAMRIIFGYHRNAMIDAMQLELNLPCVCDRIHEASVKAVDNCVRQSGPSNILKELRCNRSKSAFIRHVKDI